MTLFTSVTKKTYIKSIINLIFISLFLIIFNSVYESFSYGESSLYMKQMFLIPLVASLVYLLSSLGVAWLTNRLSILLFNSSLAILVSGCLIKGIIEISGRTTTLDQPYWWLGALFAGLSLLIGFYKPAPSRQTNP